MLALFSRVNLAVSRSGVSSSGSRLRTWNRMPGAGMLTTAFSRSGATGGVSLSSVALVVRARAAMRVLSEGEAQSRSFHRYFPVAVPHDRVVDTTGHDGLADMAKCCLRGRGQRRLADKTVQFSGIHGLSLPKIGRASCRER